MISSSGNYRQKIKIRKNKQTKFVEDNKSKKKNWIPLNLERFSYIEPLRYILLDIYTTKFEYFYPTSTSL